MKQRRTRRVYHNWSKELVGADKRIRNNFYNSTDFDVAREKVLERDNYECQFFAGKWDDGIHKPDKIKPVRATMVHHIKSIKERPDLCLDLDNLVSLSFDAHEIIEDRHRFRFKKKKNNKFFNDERW